MSPLAIVLTTIDSEAKAEDLSTQMVTRRLAACAQIEGPIRSIYWWKGALETTTEWRITFKTIELGLTSLIAAIKTHHPYDTPEIVAWPIPVADEAYQTWIETTQKTPE